MFHRVRTGNRLVGIIGAYTIIRLPDRVPLATKLEHFVGKPPSNANDAYESIPGVYAVENGRNIIGTSIGTFFCLNVRISNPLHDISTKVHLHIRQPRYTATDENAFNIDHSGIHCTICHVYDPLHRHRRNTTGWFGLVT